MEYGNQASSLINPKYHAVDVPNVTVKQMPKLGGFGRRRAAAGIFVKAENRGLEGVEPSARLMGFDSVYLQK